MWFIAHLNDDILKDSISCLEEVFFDNQLLLNDLKSYFYLKFRNNKVIKDDLTF